MIKCLIVDDEMISREGVFEAVNWGLLGIEVIGLAKNGEEGLELFREYRPDIVISDVKMPIMDGLKMIEQIVALDSTVKIILLSAYSEFNYAQQAIGFGVKNYLLKPVDDLELIKAIERLVNEKVQESKQKDDKQLRELMNNGALSMDEGLGVAIIIQDDRSKGEAFLISDGIYDGQYIKIFRIPKHDWLNFLSNQKNGFVSDLSLEGDLTKAYDQARAAAYNGEFWQIETLSWPLLVRQRRKWTNSAFLRNKTLETLVEKYPRKGEENQQKFLIQIAQFIRMLTQYTGCDKDEIWRYYYEVFLRLENYFFILGDENNKLKVKDQLSLCKTFEELSNKFQNLIMEVLSKKQIDSEHEIISRIKQIVNERFAEEISSRTVAEEVFLSPNYMGKLFRTSTGYYLNDYILEVRMKKAKEFLVDTEMSISEIAEAVGIGSASYFTSLFKKTYRQTPKKFRRSKQR